MAATSTLLVSSVNFVTLMRTGGTSKRGETSARPVHEDHDVLGLFSPYEVHLDHPGNGLFQIGCAVSAFLTICLVVKATLPETPAYPREFEDGLERELGGSGAIRVGTPDHIRNGQR